MLLSFATLILNVFFSYINNLQVFKQKSYSHQVFIYLDVPGIAARNTITEYLIKQLDVGFGVIYASFFFGRAFISQ